MNILSGLMYVVYICLTIAYIGVTVAYIVILVKSVRVFKAFSESNANLSKEINNLAEAIAKKK